MVPGTCTVGGIQGLPSVQGVAIPTTRPGTLHSLTGAGEERASWVPATCIFHPLSVP